MGWMDTVITRLDAADFRDRLPEALGVYVDAMGYPPQVVRSRAAAWMEHSADAAQLDELPGVGPVTAAKILAWRDEHGRFARVEELQEVDGIGPKTYAEIAPHVRV